jgi:hypothetical protein
MSSHAGYNATVTHWGRRCLGDVAMVQCRCQVMLATTLPSHAGDGGAEVTWPRRNLDAE